MSLTYQDVADFILAKFAEIKGKDTVTPMQLQKLVFYAQGIYLALYDEVLFHQKIQAWEYGPVINPMYHEYKDYGDSAIKSKELDSSKYDKEISVFLTAICGVFLAYTAFELSDMTHREAPWKNAYKERENREITIDAMKDFFKSSDYIQQVQNKITDLSFDFDLEKIQSRVEGHFITMPEEIKKSSDIKAWLRQTANELRNR